ncbi:MAG: hypothetical protein Q8876_09795 [Bacillota bacterium]|nr:hypothetical protein [Bacillota bacterium]
MINVNCQTREITETPDEITEVYIPPNYDDTVVNLIRQKYTIDNEFALQRQRETKPDDFKTYFDYCEQCKAQAQKICGIEQVSQ